MDYTSPVNQLLTRGVPPEEEWFDWPDYRAAGIGPEHVSELMAMMLDMELHRAEDDRVWGPVHAWRALAQMQISAAAKAYLDMLALFDKSDEILSDWPWEDARTFFTCIGPAAITPLADFLDDQTQSGFVRGAVAGYLADMAEAYPETRAQSVGILAGHLERAAANDPELNGWVVSALVRLKAGETGAVIEKVIADGRADTRVCGSWESVAYDLGLSKTPPASRRVNTGWFLPSEFEKTPLDREQIKTKNKNRARAKMARASRKRNRKRR